MSEKIKFIEFSSYGSDISDALQTYFLNHSKIGTGMYSNRYGDVIEFIEKNTIIINPIADIDIITKFCENHKDKFIKFVDRNEYFGYNSKFYKSSFSIVELDSDKKYTIEVYDGSESVIELPTYKCVDNTVNMYERIGWDWD